MTVNVMSDFHAVGDGIADDAPKIQAAIATGDTIYLPTPPVGYRIGANNLGAMRPGQEMFGDDRLRSRFLVSSPVPGTGIIDASTGDAGPRLRDFGISFTQPDTNVRANLVTYPPAIYARNAPRMLIERVYIERATVGADLANCGEAVFRDFECGAFSKHVAIDSCFDPVTLDHVLLGAWGVTPNQSQITNDPGTVGIFVGKCDGLKITDSTVGCGTGLQGYRAPNGTPSVQVVNTGFEVGAVILNGGFMTFAGGYFSADGQAVRLNAGDVTLTGVRMNSAAPGVSAPLVEIAAGAALTWAGGTIFTATQDRSAVKSTGPGAVMNLSGLTVFRDPGVAYSQPTFWKVAGDATITGTRAGNSFGAGSCQIIRVDVDGYDLVAGNVLYGGTASFPASPLKGVYGPNGH